MHSVRSGILRLLEPSGQGSLNKGSPGQSGNSVWLLRPLPSQKFSEALDLPGRHPCRRRGWSVASWEEMPSEWLQPCQWETNGSVCVPGPRERQGLSGHGASPPAAAAASVCVLGGQHPGGAVAEREPLRSGGGGRGTAARAGGPGPGPLSVRDGWT